ncbi:hypothetical protein [Clostridium culturomicium]|uniref:hypothetical protein n=1 Tax=Clostridium culturomicium TaxID=1499683 RepID=UPI003857800F
MVCPFCVYDKCEDGELITPYGFNFRAESSRFLKSKESPVVVKVCLNCGRLFDFKVKNLEKINK